MSIEDLIARHIADEIAVEGDQREIVFDEDLIDSGILDSLALLRLVVFIEDRFGVTIDGEELVPENFRTINNMKTLIEKKR